MDWIAIGYIVLDMVISAAVEAGVRYVLERAEDEAGRFVTRIVHYFDGDGDGVEDEFEVLGTIDVSIPNLDDGFCICNDGNELGIGVPLLKLIDNMEIGNYIDISDTYNLPILTGNNHGMFVDGDFDGVADEVLIRMLTDLTADGFNDYALIVDDDDNGVPDASPDAPFYPVGSDEYDMYIKQIGQEDNGIMTKEINNYTVTEGLLLLSLLINGIWFFRSLFKRENIFSGGARI